MSLVALLTLLLCTAGMIGIVIGLPCGPECPGCSTCQVESDDFDRASSSDPGAKWEHLSGSFPAQILDNTLYFEGGDTVTKCTTAQPDGVAKQSVAVDFEASNEGDQLRVFLDLVDEDNCHFAQLEAVTGTLQLYKRSGGVDTMLVEIATDTTELTGDLHACIEEESGGFTAGSGLQTISATTVAHGGTYVGLGTGAIPGAWIKVDNFDYQKTGDNCATCAADPCHMQCVTDEVQDRPDYIRLRMEGFYAGFLPDELGEPGEIACDSTQQHGEDLGADANAPRCFGLNGQAIFRAADLENPDLFGRFNTHGTTGCAWCFGEYGINELFGPTYGAYTWPAFFGGEFGDDISPIDCASRASVCAYLVKIGAFWYWEALVDYSKIIVCDSDANPGNPVLMALYQEITYRSNALVVVDGKVQVFVSNRALNFVHTKVDIFEIAEPGNCAEGAFLPFDTTSTGEKDNGMCSIPSTIRLWTDGSTACFPPWYCYGEATGCIQDTGVGAVSSHATEAACLEECVPWYCYNGSGCVQDDGTGADAGPFDSYSVCIAACNPFYCYSTGAGPECIQDSGAGARSGPYFSEEDCDVQCIEAWYCFEGWLCTEDNDEDYLAGPFDSYDECCTGCKTFESGACEEVCVLFCENNSFSPDFLTWVESGSQCIANCICYDSDNDYRQGDPCGEDPTFPGQVEVGGCIPNALGIGYCP